MKTSSRRELASDTPTILGMSPSLNENEHSLMPDETAALPPNPGSFEQNSLLGAAKRCVRDWMDKSLQVVHKGPDGEASQGYLHALFRPWNPYVQLRHPD